ncbi:MAG TPA: shikimate dehydrogenase, partial [Rhodanobacteraceae bacterium]|nr:shikimate dehydrogenase [Rhodanobacteraceae bacterium]
MHNVRQTRLRSRDRYPPMPNPSPSTPRYAVFGHPVAHSRSPAIQRAFAAQFGATIDYTTIDTTAAAFSTAIHDFFEHGGAGANVTVPHKHAAGALADVRSAAVQAGGVANVLTRLPDGRLRADNTDGSGLLRDLRQRRRFDLRDRRVLLLGAGGAARGIAAPLLAEHPREFVIVNRTHATAAALATRLGGPAIAHDWSQMATLGAFDLVLNATAAGVRHEPLPLPATLFGADTLAYDLAYGAAAEAFLTLARSAGASRTADGFGMLLETAADSFALWFGQRPDTASVYAET